MATLALPSLLCAPACSSGICGYRFGEPPGRNDCEFSRRVWIVAKSPEGHCRRKLKGINGLQRAVAQIEWAHAVAGRVPIN